MDGFGFAVTDLVDPFSRSAGRSDDHQIVERKIFTEDPDHRFDDRRLTGSRTADDDRKIIAEEIFDRFFLASIIADAQIVFTVSDPFPDPFFIEFQIAFKTFQKGSDELFILVVAFQIVAMPVVTDIAVSDSGLKCLA